MRRIGSPKNTPAIRETTVAIGTTAHHDKWATASGPVVVSNPTV